MAPTGKVPAAPTPSKGKKRYLAKQGPVSLQQLLALYKKLSGKDPTPEQQAEVQKLLVHRSARRQGIGRALMAAAEDAARVRRCWLLVLDTREGAHSDALYRRLGWTAFGRVPDYARDPDGALAACVFFMKRLSDVVSEPA